MQLGVRVEVPDVDVRRTVLVRDLGQQSDEVKMLRLSIDGKDLSLRQVRAHLNQQTRVLLEFLFIYGHRFSRSSRGKRKCPIPSLVLKCLVMIRAVTSCSSRPSYLEWLRGRE